MASVASEERHVRSEALSLDAAIVAFIEPRDPKAASARDYRATFRELKAAYPGYVLKAFEPAAGKALVAGFLEERWGQKAPATYRKKLSGLHTFFEWHRAAG